MCGICGYITKQNIADNVLPDMTNTMIHRGPDDQGTWDTKVCDWNIGLGHRRLSIIDLSAQGHQPMLDDTGNYSIVFNGEIYNYRELRDELKQNYGIGFRSNSDTEVLLKLYIAEGIESFTKLNGMFAFAIFDSNNNTLVLARDRMGEKPLYYYCSNGEFVFASELKAIMQYPGFSKEINKDVLVQYFSQNTILPPNTIFNDTYKLSAGEYLVWNDGNITKGVYYSVVDSYRNGVNNLEYDYNVCKRELKDLIIDSVSRRLISDVPFGSFLSGGIDSTLISAIANEVTPGGIDTFSIGFEDEKYNEAEYAKQSAYYLGTKHHEMAMNEKQMLSMLDELVYYYDEPFSDSSQLPTMLVAQFAKQNVTVTVSGDGGDELFAGYTCNDTLSKLRRYDWLITPARTICPSILSNNFAKDRDRILLSKKSREGKIQYYTQIKEDIARRILLSPQGKGTISLPDSGSDNWLQQRMLIDMTAYLPDEIMTKADRASMRFSLEMRAPLLDYRIVDYSMHIPLEYKYSNGDKKHILKDILYDYVPKEMMDRPKTGFAAPIYRWLNTILKDRLEEYTSREFLDKQGIFDYIEIQRLLERFWKKDESAMTSVVWGVLIFQDWCKKYIG